MPFFQDIGVRDERRGPVTAAFAAVADQLERVVLLNIAWSIQLLPGVLALAFPEWPLALRIGLLVLTGMLLPPSTAVLAVLAATASRHEHLSLELAAAAVRESAVAGYRVVAPLYGSLALLAGGWLWSYLNGVFLLEAILMFAALTWLVCATWWLPLLAEAPRRSAVQVARDAAALAWRHPGLTLALVGVQVLVALVGAISIGGVFLIVPVLAAMIGSCGYARASARRNGVDDAW